MPDFKIFAEIFLLGFVWAGETALGKLYLMAGGPSTAFPALLNLGAVVLVSAYALAKGDFAVFRLSAGRAWAISLSAVSLIFVPYLVIYLALKTLSPAEIALVSSLTPVCAVLLASAVRRAWPGGRTIAAVAAGFVGAAVLALAHGDGGVSPAHLLWIAAMLVVPVSYALSGFAIKLSSEQGVGYLQLTLYMNAISLAIFLAINGPKMAASLGNHEAALYACAGIVLNLVASAVLLDLAKRTSAVKLSFSNYSTIFWSSLASVLFFSQPTDWAFFTAVLLIIGSAHLINSERRDQCPTN